MLEKGTAEISGKRRGRNSVNNPTKSFTSNGNSNNSWEEGSSPSSSDDEHGKSRGVASITRHKFGHFTAGPESNFSLCFFVIRCRRDASRATVSGCSSGLRPW